MFQSTLKFMLAYDYAVTEANTLYVVTVGLLLVASVSGNLWHRLDKVWCLFRSQAARGNEGKDGLSEMGTRLDPVPGLPGGEFKNNYGALIWVMRKVFLQRVQCKP